MAEEEADDPQFSDESTESGLSFQEVKKNSINGAQSYLHLVRTALGPNSVEYVEFLDLMKDFKTHRIGIEEVTSRVKVLFKEQPALLIGFNNFLPTGYEINVPLSVELHFEEAIKFIKKVKTHFLHDEGRYASFLRIFDEYLRKNKSILEVYPKMSFLFHDRPDLLLEFRNFLPDTKTATSQSTVSNAEQTKRWIAMKKGSMLLCLFIVFIAIALGMGIRFGHYSTN